MAGGGDAHLGGLGGARLALAEGAEDFGAHVLGTGDLTAGGCLVAGGFGRAVGLGAGHHLATEGFANAHFQGGFGGGSGLGPIAIGATGARASTTGGSSRTGLALQFAHLLGQLPGGEVGMAETHGGGRAPARITVGQFAALTEGLTTGQRQGTTGVVLGCCLPRAGAAGGGGAAIAQAGAAAATGPGAGKGQRRGAAMGGWGPGVLALALVLCRASGGRRCCRGLGDIGAGAIPGGFRPFAPLAEGFTAGPTQLTAWVRHRLGGTAVHGLARRGQGPAGLGTTRGATDFSSQNRVRRRPIGAGGLGIAGRAHAAGGLGVTTDGFFAASR